MNIYEQIFGWGQHCFNKNFDLKKKTKNKESEKNFCSWKHWFQNTPDTK